ncbi:hypothetical protein ACFXAZ_34525 [Streptomyces sp. NPDC059477]|uniref:hypothetical protein n=1 Tax=Streptomyces sp. NPDC059477 TaxID=3346847 RepID=UPI003696DC19
MANHQAPHDTDPFTAVESLRAALDQVGIVLPSLAVTRCAPSIPLMRDGRRSL